ncbi:SRPBCC domain-containing protein [Sinorhizobium meliloti]|uniref:SRPBCC domain-containing protein n=1 Tax=Rhizobium meliloti TaxID=382 RepID=UPI000FD7487E|nr:SRPBCC domain-containing protein [Sinorhizobium meliloti]MDE3810993.1 SRPBCC domain-containing protein [Sinorhizobium meliloti]MDE3825803.1 SRPBCC domain-containing protein [Sinorhizobium meliloti]MDW9763471.1 ATPase [Sinorhizobium meliloti]RVG50335.1 ATPase [Sinorhizobium meliloti]RVI03826.1 ATPase [Sinorhizobium meliloti]
MAFEFRVNGRIARPVGQVFDAVVNPDQLSRYFVTLGGISGPLIAGTTVTWWGEVPIKVEAVEPNERIVFCWDAMTGEGESPYQTRVEMRFQPLDDGATMVTIAESGWRENEQGQKSSYLNCEGWSQMLACMKAWVEYGINLREGYYVSELSGKPALEPQL